jgi:hypothetical protein
MSEPESGTPGRHHPHDKHDGADAEGHDRPSRTGELDGIEDPAELVDPLEERILGRRSDQERDDGSDEPAGTEPTG